MTRSPSFLLRASLLVASCGLLGPDPAQAAPPAATMGADYIREAPGHHSSRTYVPITSSQSVDVYSGALVVSVPLWSAPQKGDLELSLALNYSSKATDHRKWGGSDGPDGQGGTEDDVLPHWFRRTRDSWAGVGWTLCLGRVARVVTWQDNYSWQYIDATGARHPLFLEASSPDPSLPDTYTTRNGSFVRAELVRSTDTWTIYEATGLVGVLDHRESIGNYDADLGGGYYLTRKADRSGNSYVVNYSADAEIPGSIDSIVDSYDRLVSFSVHASTPGDGLDGRLAGIDVPAFGGARAVTTFTYETWTADQVLDPNHGGTVVPRNVASLRTITAPLGHVTTFEGLSGISAIVHPTGGRIEYEQGDWEWSVPVKISPTDVALSTIKGNGVIRVDTFVDGDRANRSATNHWTRSFRRGCQIPATGSDGDGSDYQEGADGSCWGRVEVDEPDGNTTRYQFVQRRHTPGTSSPLAFPLTGRELVRTLYEGACSDLLADGVDDCAGREVQRIVTSYELDLVDGWPASIVEHRNIRVAGQTTQHFDGEGELAATTTTSRCHWTGFGDFAMKTRSATGTLEHAPMTSATLHTPDPVSWNFASNLGEYVEQGGWRTRTESRYDALGRPRSRRAVAELEVGDGQVCPMAPTAALPPSPDLPACLRPLPDTDGDGAPDCGAFAVLVEPPRYSDWPSLSTAARVAHSQPLAFAEGDIRVDHAYHAGGDGQGKVQSLTRSRPIGPQQVVTDRYAWSWGELATVERLGLSPPWLSYDVDVDPHTGLISRMRDSAGVGVSFGHDLLGRLVRSHPDGEAPTTQEYLNARQVSVRRAAADGVSEDHFRHDGLGRLLAHERRLPDGTLTSQQFEHDSSSRLVRQSRWQRLARAQPFQSLPSPDSWIATTYEYVSGRTGATLQDALGRVRSQLIGGGQEVLYEYPSPGRRRTVQFGLNGDPAAMRSTVASSDGLGRVVRLKSEQEGSTEALFTHDVHGQLASVTLVGRAQGQEFTQLRTLVRDGLGHLRLTEEPESGLTEYVEHDVEGRVVQMRDAKGAAEGYTLDFDHDAAGRLLRIRQSWGTRSDVLVEYLHDGLESSCPGDRDLGKRTGERVPLPQWGGQYQRCIRHSGVAGRADLVRVDLALDGMVPTYFESTFEHGDRGLLLRESLPDAGSCPDPNDCTAFPAGGELRHVYKAGLPFSSMHAPSGAGLTVEEWSPTGAPEVLVHGAAFRRTITRDALQRTANIIVAGLDGDTLWRSGTFTYDGLGNISAIGVSGSIGTHPQSFTHDAHGRLVRAVLPGNVIDYAYDDFGNLTERSATKWLDEVGASFTGRVHHSVGTHDNRIHGRDWGHDPNGNVTRSPHAWASCTWDALNRLTSVSDAAGASLGLHAYDGDGERILTSAAGELRYHYRGPDAQVRAEFVASGLGWRLDRVHCVGPLGEHAVARADGGGDWQVRHLGKDHLGSPRVITDPGGAVESLHLYSPFGVEAEGAGAAATSHRFTGHERDESTGLDYMHARYMASESGRFLSPDPVRGSPQDAQSWNRYAYVRNGPTGLVDPTGRVPTTPGRPEDAWGPGGGGGGLGGGAAGLGRILPRWRFNLFKAKAPPRSAPPSGAPKVKADSATVRKPARDGEATRDAAGGRPKGAPKPSPQFKPPANPPQLPPSSIPDETRLFRGKPTPDYPNGYWKLEKFDGQGWQRLDPRTMKPSPHPDTHVPLPDGYSGPFDN